MSKAMKTYRLRTQIWLKQSRDRVFKFFADPHNLERLTPPWLHFEILTAPDITIRQGTLLDYRLRLRGIPLRWQSEISVWQPPHQFVDRQIKGPYKLWVHEHTFAEQDNGTVVGDYVEYAVAGGPLVQKFFVAPDLEQIFQYRYRVLQNLFNLESRAPAQ
jgi:ligand-binding SRPBCC domain-containing protein